jgi:hypothetical protein
MGGACSAYGEEEMYIQGFGDQIEKNEMGGACSAYGEEEMYIQGFGGET